MRGARKIRLPLIVSAVVVVLTAGWAGWWWLAGQTLQRGLAAWTAEQQAHGGEVRFAGLRLSGFPLHIRATLDDVTLTLGDGLTWRGPGAEVEAPLWAVNALHFRLVGQQEVRLPVGPSTVTAAFAGGEGWATLGGTLGFTEARAALSGLSVAEGAAPGAAVASFEVSASAPAAAVTEHTETGLMVTVTADGVRLPLAGSVPLGPILESLALTARVMGAPPHPDPAGLTAWSSAGGTVELDSASLHWGPLALEGKGTLALDRDLQPVGAVTAEVAGFDQAIDALVAAGWLKPKNAQTARAVLAGLVQRPEGAPPSDNPTVNIPFFLHDHFVHVGPFRLAPLPTLVWQHPAAG